LLPLSLWGMERFFQKRRIGLFIFSVALTLFSNFYFSYYQAIVLGIYFILRVIFKYRCDIVSRWEKFYLLVIGAILALLSSILGFYTG
ncbi:YfhO family protein, partial [Staphylococcus warneri]